MRTGWLCFLDADEFLVLEHAWTVEAFLAQAGAAGMPIALNWRIFGSSGEVSAGPGLVIDRFVRCGRATEDVNRHIKTLGPTSILKDGARVHVHGWVLERPGLFTVDAAGRPVSVEGCTFTAPCWHGAWINHYIVKSREEFEAKRRRGKATHARSAPDKHDRDYGNYFTPYDRNEEEDRTIHRFRGRLIAGLRQLQDSVAGRSAWLDNEPTSKEMAVLSQSARVSSTAASDASVAVATHTKGSEVAKMIVLPSYGSLVGANARGIAFVEVVKSQLHELLKSLVNAIEVDEFWYLQTYRDVADAVAEGRLMSGGDHYRQAGYFEDRMPRRIDVDETWYLSAYPDVKEAIANRAFQTAQQHFERDGFREGRLPSKDWTLWTIR